MLGPGLEPCLLGSLPGKAPRLPALPVLGNSLIASLMPGLRNLEIKTLQKDGLPQDFRLGSNWLRQGDSWALESHTGQVQRLEMSGVEAWGGRLPFQGGGTGEAPGGAGA